MAVGFSTTAFAYADDTEQDLPVTEATLPEDMPPADETTEQPTEPDMTPGELFDDDDLDFYDDDGYEDGPYVNEDEDKEPDIADDDEDEETDE